MLRYKHIQSPAHRITFWCCIAVWAAKTASKEWNKWSCISTWNERKTL